jgi:hypothetical protein
MGPFGEFVFYSKVIFIPFYARVKVSKQDRFVREIQLFFNNAYQKKCQYPDKRDNS